MASAAAAKKVAAIPDSVLLRADQPEVRLVDQGRRLEGLTRMAVPEILSCIQQSSSGFFPGPHQKRKRLGRRFLARGSIRSDGFRPRPWQYPPE